MDIHQIINYIKDNNAIYKYNNYQLELIEKSYKDIQGILNKRISNIKNLIFFIFIPILLILTTLLTSGYSFVYILIVIEIAIAYFYIRNRCFKAIEIALEDFMEIKSIKEMIENPETNNILQFIIKCTYLKNDQHMVDLENIMSGLNIIIKTNKFNNEFIKYEKN